MYPSVSTSIKSTLLILLWSKTTVFFFGSSLTSSFSSFSLGSSIIFTFLATSAFTTGYGTLAKLTLVPSSPSSPSTSSDF